MIWQSYWNADIKRLREIVDTEPALSGMSWSTSTSAHSLSFICVYSGWTYCLELTGAKGLRITAYSQASQIQIEARGATAKAAAADLRHKWEAALCCPPLPESE